MAAKKGLGKGLSKGLGKGLGSLIPTDDRSADTEKEPKEKTIVADDKKTSVKGKKASSDKKTAASNKTSKKTAADSEKDKKTRDDRSSQIPDPALNEGKNDKNDMDDFSGTKGLGETMVKISLIEPNKSQPRKNFDIEALKELSDSIRDFGLLQPIVVRKKDDKYFEIIAGERRWRAAKLAKLKELPVIIREYSPEQVMEAALIENIQRQDLNPIEEALAFTHLINEYDLKQEDVALKVSKSRAQISNIMRLLKLNEKVQQMLIADEISMGHARAILAINDEDLQVEIAKSVIDNDLSVRETEKYIKEVLEPKPAKKKSPSINPAGLMVYKEMEKKMSNSIGSKVEIRTKDGKKGRIEIDYSSQEELERIFDKITN